MGSRFIIPRGSCICIQLGSIPLALMNFFMISLSSLLALIISARRNRWRRVSTPFHHQLLQVLLTFSSSVKGEPIAPNLFDSAWKEGEGVGEEDKGGKLE